MLHYNFDFWQRLKAIGATLCCGMFWRPSILKGKMYSFCKLKKQHHIVKLQEKILRRFDRHEVQHVIKHCHVFVFWNLKQRSSRQLFSPKIIQKKSWEIHWSAVAAIFLFKLYFYSIFLFVMVVMWLEMRFSGSFRCTLFVRTCKMQIY